MEQFYVHLAQMLDEVELLKGREPNTIILRLRKLFQRAQPDKRELRVLHLGRCAANGRIGEEQVASFCSLPCKAGEGWGGVLLI